LRWTGTLAGPAGPALAAAAARRFSALGLACVLVLLVSGLYNTWEQVGTVAALVGTPYGRWLLLKLGLLLPLVGLAAVNRLVVKPRLTRAVGAGDPAAAAPLMRRLHRQVVAEAVLGCAILGAVAVLGLTTPARHAEPEWPFAFRLSWEATKGLPGVQTRVAIGSQVAVLGLVAALLALLLGRRRWRWVTACGLVTMGLGLGVALPPLSVDAYPTTYLRPTVPYTAISIARGLALYREHCAVCHGVAGYGDGPAAAGLPRRPADLTARHTADHTVGDIFWWLSHGIPGSGMPGFAGRLTEEDRWDLINVVRTLASVEQARGLGPVSDPEAVIVAPDFEYGPGIGETHSLKEHRGERPVVLVLFSLPASLERLMRLNEAYPALRALGAEVLAVPIAAEDVYRALGPRLLFLPIVVDGAPEAAATYTLFRRDLSAAGQEPDPAIPPHMELLIDRQGYLRARWIPAHGERGWEDPNRLVAEVLRLVRETPRRPPPDDHVH
ncbi:MAG: CopD family protein, partial [Candidatus Rokuibacteriota bacterium]